MRYLQHIYANSKKYLLLILLSFFFVLLLKEVGVWSYMHSLYNAIIPIFIGFIIAFLFEHFICSAEKYMKHFFAVTIVYGSIVLFIGLLIIIIGPPLIDQIQVCLDYLPVLIQKINALLSWGTVPVSVNSSLDTLLNRGYAFAISTLISFSTGMNRFMFGYLAGYFISLDRDFFLHWFYKFKYSNEQQIIRFARTCSNVMSHYLIGMSLDLLFLFIAFFVTFLITKFPNPLLYAILLSLLNMIPYIGPTIGFFIIIVVSFVSYADPWVMILLIWGIQQVESNYVQPMIFKRTMDLRPILTLTMLFIGSAWLGVMGMVLAPIMAAILQIAFRSYIFSMRSDNVGSWEEIWCSLSSDKMQEPE